jgi:hypothetical protein
MELLALCNGKSTGFQPVANSAQDTTKSEKKVFPRVELERAPYAIGARLDLYGMHDGKLDENDDLHDGPPSHHGERKPHTGGFSGTSDALSLIHRGLRWSRLNRRPNADGSGRRNEWSGQRSKGSEHRKAL